MNTQQQLERIINKLATFNSLSLDSMKNKVGIYLKEKVLSGQISFDYAQQIAWFINDHKNEKNLTDQLIVNFPNLKNIFYDRDTS